MNDMIILIAIPFILATIATIMVSKYIKKKKINMLKKLLDIPISTIEILESEELLPILLIVFKNNSELTIIGNNITGTINDNNEGSYSLVLSDICNSSQQAHEIIAKITPEYFNYQKKVNRYFHEKKEKSRSNFLSKEFLFVTDSTIEKIIDGSTMVYLGTKSFGRLYSVEAKEYANQMLAKNDITSMTIRLKTIMVPDEGWIATLADPYNKDNQTPMKLVDRLLITNNKYVKA